MNSYKTRLFQVCTEEEMKNLQSEFRLLKERINDINKVESICKRAFEQLNSNSYSNW